MKRFALFPLLVVALLAAEPAADRAAIQDVEKGLRALNDAFAAGNADAIGRLMVEEHVAITPYYGRSATRADQLRTLPDLKITDYQVADLKVTLVSPDVAYVVYALTQKGSYRGKELAPRNWAAAVWVRREGKWQEYAYQETPRTDN